MTTEQIIEGNQLIAEFEGCATQMHLTEHPKTGEYTDPSEFEYHESWDWLMPVVEKINTTGKGGGLLYGLRDSLLGADIETAFTEVVEFIKWYNENK